MMIEPRGGSPGVACLCWWYRFHFVLRDRGATARTATGAEPPHPHCVRAALLQDVGQTHHPRLPQRSPQVSHTLTPCKFGTPTNIL